MQRRHRLDVGTRAGGATMLNHVDFAAVVSVLKQGGTDLSGRHEHDQGLSGPKVERPKGMQPSPSKNGFGGGKGGGELSAPYLARVLEIPGDEADDLVFLADLDRHTAHRPGQCPHQLMKEAAQAMTAAHAEAKIDVFEFYRLIVGWA